MERGGINRVLPHGRLFLRNFVRREAAADYTCREMIDGTTKRSLPSPSVMFHKQANLMAACVSYPSTGG
jgi:hypothetical protein